ncbi:MAG: DUF2141 domain-containing protein [Bacteroidota bacterium]
MKKIIQITQLFCILCLAYLNASFIGLNTKHNIKLEIIGVRSHQGKIKMGVYISSQRFEEKKDSKIITIEKHQLQNQKLSFSFYLAPGTYGFSVLDDENDNSKMDFNFFGMPKEGFGFSNYYHSGFTYPKFQNFSFTIQPGEEKHVQIKLRYI